MKKNYIEFRNFEKINQTDLPMKKFAIIVAGGSGIRMNSEIPKQFIPIKGLPIIMHSMLAFYHFDKTIQIIVALPSSLFDFWHNLCRENSFSLAHKVVPGGETRFQSVKNALAEIKESGFIAVHDAVRPLVSQDTIGRCFDTAIRKGNAIPFINIVDSVRTVEGDKNNIVDRTKLKLIQTPQIFRSEILVRAYEQEYQSWFTDDASVVEQIGYEINLEEGNRENIKITSPSDLEIAKVLIDF
jgi:2-C-methyl-D-erythritol 4-phosphate cytidylyltransferase